VAVRKCSCPGPDLGSFGPFWAWAGLVWLLGVLPAAGGWYPAEGGSDGGAWTAARP
jgi:hypothetical protein